MDSELEESFQQLNNHAKEKGEIDAEIFDVIFKLLKSKQDSSPVFKRGHQVATEYSDTDPSEPLIVTTIQNILTGLKKTLVYIECEPHKAQVFDLVAELAKSDEVRDFFVDAGWIAIALDYLENVDHNIVLHALRSIGNICYNNDLGRKALLGANGADDIVRKLESLNRDYDPSRDNRMDVVTCGCVLNLATDDEEVVEEMVTCGAMPFLLGLARQSVSSNPVLCRMAVSAVSVLISSAYGKVSFTESGGPAVLIQILKEDNQDEELSYITLEALNPLVAGDDEMKRELVKSGAAESLVHVVASCKGREDDESKKYRLETAADMIVTILTEDVCMKILFNDGKGVVVKECIKWLSSRDKHLEISGALALGNFGRTDENCIKLVEMGAHKTLLNHIPVAQQRTEPFKHLQAVFGALKNLALPVANKLILVRDGCLDACLSMLSSQSPIVLAKALGTLSAMMMVQSDIANRIVNAKGQIEVLVRLSKSTGYEDVRTEASRLLALLVKQGQTPEISNKVITCGGLPCIIEIVTSPKIIVQNEALIAMCVLASTVKVDFYPKLRETGLTQKLVKMIKDDLLNAQSCYNALAYLEALSLREYFARDLQVAGLSRVLENLMHHENENVRKRALLILTSLKAKQLQEEL